MANGTILNQTQSMDDYLRTDGTNAMTGTLQANAGILVGKKNDAPHSNIYTSPGQGLLVNSYNTLSLVNRSIDNNITRIDFIGDSISKTISFTISNAPSLILRPSSISAEKNRIINVADGTSDTDAATVGQINNIFPTSTNNQYLDFYGLTIYVKQDIPPDTIMPLNEERALNKLYRMIKGSAPYPGNSVMTFESSADLELSYQLDNEWMVTTTRVTELGGLYTLISIE